MIHYKDYDYLTILILFLAILYVSVSGLIMDFYDSDHFFFHRYAGYIAAIAAFFHLIINWPKIKAYFRSFKKKPLSKVDKQSEQEVTIPAYRAGIDKKQQLLRQRRTLFLGAFWGIGGFLGGRWSIPDCPLCLDEMPDISENKHSISFFKSANAAEFKLSGKRDRYKTYLDVKKIPLPAIDKYAQTDFGQILNSRRSIREYSSNPITLQQLSNLLFAAAGITQKKRGYRSAPSAGALFPLEIYLIVNSVDPLQPGLYHYSVEHRELEFLQKKSDIDDLMLAAVGQDFVNDASACFFISGLLKRTQKKYNKRTYRYVLLEAGHMAQNICLSAISMNLGACPVGAFSKKRSAKLLDIDYKKELPLYMITVGNKA